MCERLRQFDSGKTCKVVLRCLENMRTLVMARSSIQSNLKINVPSGTHLKIFYGSDIFFSLFSYHLEELLYEKILKVFLGL